MLFFLRGVQPNTLMIDSSTIDPAASKDVAKLASEAGATYIDAPVSGGTKNYSAYRNFDYVPTS